MNRFSDSLLTFKGIRKYGDFLQHSDRFSEGKVQGYKIIWLRSLLKHCYENIPWYSEKFRLYDVRVNAVDPFRELEKLPILSKEDLRANHADFCISGVAKRALRFTTSGTTGEPLVAYTSPNQWVFEQAAIWRQWKWADYKFRDKMAIFRSYSPSSGEPLIKIDRLRNWAYFSVFNMDDASIALYVEFLAKWRPRYLRGYPSSLLLLAQHALRHGWTLEGLKGAFVASETVPPALRETLRDAFGIEVFDHYGQSEITCMFHDCEKHEGMHLDWEYGHVELVPSETPGYARIIATNLHNRAMPLLRYDTGDLAVGYWKSCSCGRVSPIISAIHGRKDDFLIAHDGSRISTVNLYTYFSKIAEIKRFQIVQEKVGALEVYVEFYSENGNDFDDEALKGKIIYELQGITGLKIEVNRAAEWSRSQEGKFASFVQRVRR